MRRYVFVGVFRYIKQYSSAGTLPVHQAPAPLRILRTLIRPHSWAVTPSYTRRPLVYAVLIYSLDVKPTRTRRPSVHAIIYSSAFTPLYIRRTLGCFYTFAGCYACTLSSDVITRRYIFFGRYAVAQSSDDTKYMNNDFTYSSASIPIRTRLPALLRHIFVGR